jgi:diaminopimelate decarboxylase
MQENKYNFDFMIESRLMNKNQSIPLVPWSHVTTEIIIRAAEQFETPFYLYDEKTIVSKCREFLSMPHAFGLTVNYAMKANSNKAILQLLTSQGLNLDTSSLNEARRAHLAGIPYNRMMLTTQDIPLGIHRQELEQMMTAGLVYNVCSLRQLEIIADFAAAHKIPLTMRIHPGVGSGESATRNTGDDYSCFGVHRSDIEKAMAFTRDKGLVINQVHVHAGSGGDPKIWRENIDRELDFVERFFPDAGTVNFGGGFKEARMPDEKTADLQDLGSHAREMIEMFYRKTGRKLVMTVEPGTFLMANAGFLVTTVIDKKQTGSHGFKFLIVNGGMETNARPLFYGSRHPFYLISSNGTLLSTEYDLSRLNDESDRRVIVGKCCESGDSQCLDTLGSITPRVMADARVGDYVIIGGTGAYCSAMSPHNYNSYNQAAEVLLRTTGELQVIRKQQTMEQMVENEIGLEVNIE